MESDLYFGFEALPQAFDTVLSGARRALVTTAIRPDTTGDVVKNLIEFGKSRGFEPTLIVADEIDQFFATSTPVLHAKTLGAPKILGYRKLLLIDGVASSDEETRDKVFRFLFRGDSLNYVTIISLSERATPIVRNSLKTDFPLSTLWFSRRIE